MAGIESAGGPSGRSEIGAWMLSLVPVEALVPEVHAAWRPLVSEAIGTICSRLSEPRLASKIKEQMAMPADAPAELRLIRLISKMPGLQKLGQALARNRRLALPLREALCQLENGMSDVTAEEMRPIIARVLGRRLETFDVEIEPAIFKEGSACAILKFTWREAGRERQPGAFKVVKPYVPQCFAEDLSRLEEWGDFPAARERSYRFAVRDVKDGWPRCGCCWSTSWILRVSRQPWWRWLACTGPVLASACPPWFHPCVLRTSPR